MSFLSRQRALVLCGVMAVLAACGSCPGTAATGQIPTESMDKEQEASKTVKELPPEHVVTDTVEIKTSMGIIKVGLYGNDAPKTVKNFLEYVDSGFYSGKIFHRVIPGFMIQGGGFDVDLNRAPTRESIDLELIPGIRHNAGIISMARIQDPNSATSQFFLCVGQAIQLNGAYAAFGKIIEGLEVATEVSLVPVKNEGSMSNIPQSPVIIEYIKRL